MQEIAINLEKAVGPQCLVPGQRVSRHNSGALRGSMALSHFLHCFWSKPPGQPTSLNSSVKSGKKL